VVLLSRVPFGEIGVVAVDVNSRTSVALLGILLARRYGRRPRMVPMAPDAAAMLERADAALLIGDAALRARPAGLRILDLASAWYEMTALPFVFAVWAARTEQAACDSGRRLGRAVEMGLEAIRSGTLPAQAAAAGMTRTDLLAYLTRNIHFGVGAEEMRSLEIFASMCAEEGAAGGVA
jgi:chorismate dehydratase